MTWLKKNGREYTSLWKWRHSYIFEMPASGSLCHIYYLPVPYSHLNSSYLSSTHRERQEERGAESSRPLRGWASVILGKGILTHICNLLLCFCLLFSFVLCFTLLLRKVSLETTLYLRWRTWHLWFIIKYMCLKQC